MKTKLCLGTAQFGMNYGITNQMGKLKVNEIDLIMATIVLIPICWRTAL